MAIKQKVLGLPTITLYKGGEKVAELTKDDATAKNIENMLAENIK
jgi:thioredoxin